MFKLKYLVKSMVPRRRLECEKEDGQRNIVMRNAIFFILIDMCYNVWYKVISIIANELFKNVHLYDYNWICI